MARPRFLVLAALAVVAGLMAAPAWAAPKGDCLWAGTPKSARDSYLRQYRAHGAEALEQLEYGDDLAAAFPACGVATTDEANFEAGAILGTMILENGAELVLFEQAAMPIGSLPGLWRDLPEPDKATLKALGKALIGKGPDNALSQAARAIIDGQTEKLDVASPLDVHVAIYFVSRATREVLEAGGMPKPADRGP